MFSQVTILKNREPTIAKEDLRTFNFNILM